MRHVTPVLRDSGLTAVMFNSSLCRWEDDMVEAGNATQSTSSGRTSPHETGEKKTKTSNKTSTHLFTL